MMFRVQDGQPATSGRARRRGHILSAERVDALYPMLIVLDVSYARGKSIMFRVQDGQPATNTGKVGDRWYIFHTQK